MTKKLLIDAQHPEEIRVALADDSKLIEYEFESVQKKQIKSSIYLGKITRVEPSLQAAFVEYGGNRQGFLPFSEIHYDYYQIPVEDKQKLSKMVEESRKKIDDFDEEDEELENKKGKKSNFKKSGKKKPNIDIPEELSNESVESLRKAEELAKEFAFEVMGEDYVKENFSEESEEEVDEEDESFEDLPDSSLDIYKKYKIQEVIKRNQVVLVQVVKEERGNKGASLTTYLALAGRYCVFMPNTDKGGGVSRRITSFSERKRIRSIVKSMDISTGSSVIIRTAGMEQQEEDIIADYDYLKSSWNGIRSQTLESTAPALIYEESDIVRRTMRDLFKGDVEEVFIQGDAAYKTAEKFVDIFSHANKNSVKKYDASVPLFTKFKIEEKLDELYEPQIKLESGGSIVIAPTEALVAIDVNSGKATKERSVEDTALKTNLEAAKEIARQLRLRDLAGLVVIDFIDMRDVRNRKAVERELKDAVKSDRAKIQIGRISIFGLLEMSRQRLHSSLAESSSVCCPMCKGLGVVRSPESLVMKVIRAIESEAGKKTVNKIKVTASRDLLEDLNARTDEIKDLESSNEVTIQIEEDASLLPNQFEITTNKSKGKSSAGGKSKNSSKQGKASKTDHEKDKNKKSGKPGKKEYNKRPHQKKKPSNNSNDNLEDISDYKKKSSSDDENPASKTEDENNSKLKGLWKKITS